MVPLRFIHYSRLIVILQFIADRLTDRRVHRLKTGLLSMKLVLKLGQKTKGRHLKNGMANYYEAMDSKSYSITMVHGWKLSRIYSQYEQTSLTMCLLKELESMFWNESVVKETIGISLICGEYQALSDLLFQTQYFPDSPQKNSFVW